MATDPWGNSLTYDPARDLASLTDAELVELFGPDPTSPIPEAKLDSPTLGAIRRQEGIDGWSDHAKVSFAVEVVQEAQRYILLERLDSIGEFLAVGATPDQAVARIERLVAEYRGMAA